MQLNHLLVSVYVMRQLGQMDLHLISNVYDLVAPLSLYDALVKFTSAYVDEPMVVMEICCALSNVVKLP